MPAPKPSPISSPSKNPSKGAAFIGLETKGSQNNFPSKGGSVGQSSFPSKGGK